MASECYLWSDQYLSIYHKISIDTNNWYQGVCASIFRIKTESKRKYTLTITESDLEDKIRVVKKRRVQEQVINIQKPSEPSVWEKLLAFLRKIILFASSNSKAETSPSENYIEFLNCKNSKAVLLLLSSIAAKDRCQLWAQSNMISNMLKSLWLG